MSVSDMYIQLLKDFNIQSSQIDRFFGVQFVE